MQFHVFLHLKQTIAVSTYCCSFAVMSCFQGIQRVWQGEGRVRGVAWHSKIGCEEHCWINLYTEIGFYLFVLALFCLFIGFFFKERGTSTEPPPRANFSATANQVELEYTPYHYYTKIHCPFVTFAVFDIIPFQINIKAFSRSLCCFSKKKWAPCPWLAPCSELAP